uniref:Uncharacterized protein n=1 Tax=Anguilla anguilla TaxID=7936 RepID=A0A0E9Q7U6_ANGAN
MVKYEQVYNFTTSSKIMIEK